MENQAGSQMPKMERRKNLVVGGLSGLAVGLGLGLFLENYIISVCLGLLVGIMLGYRLDRYAPVMKYPPSLIRRMLLWGTIFWATSVAVFHFMRIDQNNTLRILLSLAPIVPGTFFVVSIGTAIARLDEMQRKIQVESLAISFAGTALVALSYGLLGFAGVKQANWLFVPLVMVLFWLVGKLWTMGRYR